MSEDSYSMQNGAALLDDDGNERCEDRSLYITLSMYISEAKVAATLGSRLTPRSVEQFQPGYLNSAKLRDAVDPLFNDIADRERRGRIDDFLLGALGGQRPEFVTVDVPDTIIWKTEGAQSVNSLEGLNRKRSLRVRRFWYAHVNGALSYHLSIRYDYTHSIADLYFLSLLQKVAAPKEFPFAADAPAHDGPARVTNSRTGIQAIDAVTISTDGKDMPFWHYVRTCFDTDAAHLFAALSRHVARPAGGKAKGSPKKALPAASFDTLIQQAPFIEVPGLEMPVSRLLFFFQDKTFFDQLLPVDPTTLMPVQRGTRMDEEFGAHCGACLEDALQSAPNTDQTYRLDAAFWSKLLSYKLPDGTPLSATADAPEALRYMFLAGFNQNIIDFLNQDASEVLDSLDPIYPENEAQEAERKFIRYANPRAMITYVQSSRSLETANDYIGTCPYAFLIHILSMHNEFLTREYEDAALQLVSDVRADNASSLREAARHFYDFRTGPYEAYYRDRYMNIFRYDTEGDVFEKMTQLRGIARRNDYVERLVSNVESQTRDREARMSKRDESAMSVLLGALGVFGLFQLMFNWADVLNNKLSLANPGDWMALFAFGISALTALVLVVGFSVWFFFFRNRG
ncbi:MAG: hypothetical protein R3C13_11790 [Hyphomonas sp.]|uniref:hypothetical protein n=1 Tax=Hyphomonas sp. TaxID=87 RepID=UPI00352891CE